MARRGPWPSLGGRPRCRLAEGLALGGAPYGHRGIIPRNAKAQATLITPAYATDSPFGCSFAALV
jgi:hypothetical protein